MKKEEILNYLKELKKDSVFSKVGLFGSYAKGDFDAYSDVDIAVQFDRNYLKTHDVWDYFDAIGSIQHQIMQRFGLKNDIFDLDSASPLREQIEKGTIYV